MTPRPSCPRASEPGELDGRRRSAGSSTARAGRSGTAAEPSPTTRRGGIRSGPLPYVLVAPVIIFIAGLALVPAVFTIVQSFFTVNALDPPTRFSGLANFRNLAESDAIRSSVANTALYVVVGVALSTVLGVAMAILLQRPFRGRSLVIAVLILPWALPGRGRGHPLERHLRPERRPGLEPDERRRARRRAPAARREPAADDRPHRARAGLADHPALGAARAGRAAAHPRRALRGRADRRLQPLGRDPDDHAPARPARHRGLHGAGAGGDPQRLRPAVRAERRGGDRRRR